MPQQQEISPFNLDLLKTYAREKYPGFEESVAVKEYVTEKKIKGVFWKDENGNRCIWGPNVENLITKYWRHNTTQFDGGGSSRTYYYEKGPITLKMVNRPNSKGYRILTTHISETIGNGWNLPKGDPHHLLSLPLDIVVKIFDFLLVLPKAASMRPKSVTCNWKQAWCPVHFSVIHRRTMFEAPDEVAHVQRKDEEGPYTEFRVIRRPKYNAAFLRTSKRIYEIGNPILYGNNKFNFGMLRIHDYGTPPSWENEGNRHSQSARNLSPLKPGQEEWKAAIKEGKLQIQQRVPALELKGWIYWDPMLRFLHAIGPNNAALVNNMTFSGIVKLHTCAGNPSVESSNDECGRHCDDDLVRSLRLYTPFLRRFFRGLEVLTIYPLADNKYHDEELPSWRPKTEEDAMVMLLERSIPDIISLKELNVLQYERDDGEPEEYSAYERGQEERGKDIPIKYAECFSAAVKLRADQEKESRTFKPSRNVSAAVGCEFCGEGHLWVHCYNLCNQCGDFGHWGKNCSRAAVDKRERPATSIFGSIGVLENS